MKKTYIFSFILCLLFVACDPGYYLAVVNNSNQYKEVSLRSKLDSAICLEIVPNDIFAEGKFIEKKELKKDTILSRHNIPPYFRSADIPPNRKVIIESYIGGYPIKSEAYPIIINNDTINPDSIKVKRKLGSTKYIIELK
ncbi:hypothetical protein M2451_000744 [Dysgonomonas sp. PFB1-18]|uniref:hypothetical protein n=1 Tax=unclassified Dysgonomonas TaxID=2630389 RepID=UPI002475B6EE|nr:MULTISPECIES: hypothetical protein [unclassified Dysgonomonas]MDH6308433.1 hypothetical protein [Dysgonomonas sp. PF1-14]MDH6337934.1 hypothetical protein [Dysgonomonas sp. PF1-16]MDH6379431.1 hypothetical protein [Dysgonomonas sp. PFB1-18]MDH6396762.1 hypothetical protein [Dysgonomonas sp. PF1-23]